MLMGFHQLSGKVKQDVNLLPNFLRQSGISLLSFVLARWARALLKSAIWRPL